MNAKLVKYTRMEQDCRYFNGQARHIPGITLKTIDGRIDLVELSAIGERQCQIETPYSKKIIKCQFINSYVPILK